MKNHSRNNWQDGRHFHKPHVPVPSSKTRVTPIAARASWARVRTEYDPPASADQTSRTRVATIPGTCITVRVTGYDPKLGRDHPDNRDGSLERGGRR